MDIQTWTPDAIDNARRIVGTWLDWTEFVGIAASPFAMYALTLLYCRSLHRIYLGLVPSMYFVCQLAALGVALIRIYAGFSIHFFGLHFGVPPVLPRTCNATSKIIGPDNKPCQIERLHEWLREGSWYDICTWDTVGFICAVGLLLMVFVGLGAITAGNFGNRGRGGLFWLWCDGCAQERKRKDWNKVDYGSGGGQMQAVHRS